MQNLGVELKISKPLVSAALALRHREVRKSRERTFVLEGWANDRADSFQLNGLAIQRSGFRAHLEPVYLKRTTACLEAIRAKRPLPDRDAGEKT